MKKRRIYALLLAVVLVLECAACSAGNKTDNSDIIDAVADGNTVVDEGEGNVANSDSTDVGADVNIQTEDMSVTDMDSLKAVRDKIWEEYLEQLRNDPTRRAEVDERKMTYGDVTMKYGFQKKGKPSENGYPLYIALHGGGQSDTPDVNDGQWAAMAIYYGNNVRNGIYVNPRGVRDTWDTHFNPESYPLYDRLIENMIAFCDADPDRVYIMGYSAGGDGVYAISSRMTDRFAAANMSAGHPNGTSLLNLCDMPIQLQVGRLDTSYDRHRVTAEYGLYLDSLAEEYGSDHYIHRVYVHADYAHNFYDNNFAEQNVIADIEAWLNEDDCTTVKADTNAVNFVKQYSRNPLPELVVWDLSVRAPERKVNSNYWLRVGMDRNTGVIAVKYSKEDNSITVEKDGDGADFEILLNEEMLDVFSPITVNGPAGSVTVNVTPDSELIRETTYERGDRNYQFCVVLKYKELFDR